MASADEQNFLAPPVLAGEEDALAQAVRKAQKGDHAAFVSLYQRYKASIWQRLTYFVGEREAAQDLFQETFLRAWLKLPELKSGVPFESWLKPSPPTLLLITCATRSRRFLFHYQRKTGRAELRPSFGARRGRRRSLISGRVSASPCKPCRRKIVPVCCSRINGFSQREIAQLLHISEKSVSAYVSRGREQLRRAYLDLNGAAPEQMRKGEHDERAE